MRTGELVYGLAVAVDIESFTRRGLLEQSAAQQLLADLWNYAAASTGLDRDDWYRQARGDGELAVLPTNTDVAWVVARFTHHLADALRQAQTTTDPLERLRLRLAMNHGPVTNGEFGPVGATTVACRLLDARPTKNALANNPDEDLVLAISAQLFQDVVLTRFHGLDPGRFSAMRVSIKGTLYRGHLCLGSPTVG